MLWLMEMDRLIDMGKDYVIEFRGGALLIDGREQPWRVQDKYRNYFIEENGKIFKKTELSKKEFLPAKFLKSV